MTVVEIEREIHTYIEIERGMEEASRVNYVIDYMIRFEFNYLAIITIIIR